MLDLTPVFQPVLETAGLAVAGLIGIYVPKCLAAFEARTGIMLSEQQRQVVLGAVQTAAGVIETRLDQGAMQLAHIDVGNPAVLAEAHALLSAVPEAGRAMGLTPDAVARMIVGRIDTASRMPAAPVAVPVAAPGAAA